MSHREHGVSPPYKISRFHRESLLAGTPTAVIGKRDGVNAETARIRRYSLIKALKRHVIDQQTTCEQERAYWAYMGEGENKVERFAG